MMGNVISLADHRARIFGNVSLPHVDVPAEARADARVTVTIWRGRFEVSVMWSTDFEIDARKICAIGSYDTRHGALLTAEAIAAQLGGLPITDHTMSMVATAYSGARGPHPGGDAA